MRLSSRKSTKSVEDVKTDQPKINLGIFSEEAAAQYADMNGTQPNGQQQNHKGADLKHRHSLHTTHVNHLRINDADLANGFEVVLRNVRKITFLK